MRQNRLPLVLLMAGSLVAASVWRGSSIARTSRAESTAATQPTGQSAPAQSFGQFDSYTLGLLLGGLRGPLVMTLWSSSETQKSERNLEDINTKIELIGLLQPEFDAVHLFQIWNKAYNLSVQMSNLAGKYSTILDAIDYANKRRLDRGQNINLESALASVYFDKLGSSSEKTYYRERVRDETIAPRGQVQFVFPSARRDEFVKLALQAGADARRYSIRPEGGGGDLLRARLRADYAGRMIDKFKGENITTTRIDPRSGKPGTNAMRSAMDPVLDPDGFLLPSYVQRDSTRPIGDMDWPQNGELSYLVRFEPYPDGLSPYAFAFNYYKRAVALQESVKQRHAQLSERVISSRPALSLKSWSEEELERGRLAEMAQFGLAPLPETQSALPNELPAANLPLNGIAKTPLIDEAIYCYQRSSVLAGAAITEYRQHLERYREDASTYVSHMAHTMAMGELATADAYYLQTAIAQGEQRTRFAQMAAAHYRRTLDLLSLNVLAFYAPDEMLNGIMPEGYGKIDAMNAFENPAAFPADQIAPTITRVYQLAETPEFQSASEIAEYRTYSTRAAMRLNTLRSVLNP